MNAPPHAQALGPPAAPACLGSRHVGEQAMHPVFNSHKLITRRATRIFSPIGDYSVLSLWERRPRPALSCGPCRRRLRVPLVLGAGCVGSGGARPRLTPSGSRAAHGSPFLRQPQGRWAGPPSSARASRGPPPAAQWGQRLRPPRGVAGSSRARDRERVPAQLREALGRPCERPSPASRPSGPAPRHWAGVSVGREWPSVEEAAPEAPGGLEQQPQGPRVPPRPPTAACLQGPSSSPTSSPWPSRGSRSST